MERPTPMWQRVAAFLLWLSGLEVAQVQRFEVSNVISRRSAVRREAWTEAENDQMEQDREEEAEWQERLGDWMLAALEGGGGDPTNLRRPPLSAESPGPGQWLGDSCLNLQGMLEC